MLDPLMFRLANILKHSDWKTNNLTPRMAHLVTQLCASAAHGRHMLKPLCVLVERKVLQLVLSIREKKCWSEAVLGIQAKEQAEI